MPEQVHWPEVRDAIRERMRLWGMDDSELRQKTRLAPGTLNSVLTAKGSSNESTLVAISAVLGWPYDYLINILHGESHRNVLTESPAERAFKQAARERLKALNDEIARLNDIFNDTGEESGQIVDAHHLPDDQ